jgi:hypothetical protein
MPVAPFRPRNLPNSEKKPRPFHLSLPYSRLEATSPIRRRMLKGKKSSAYKWLLNFEHAYLKSHDC